MALANITIFIAQAAALVILIFALISYMVYKVRSRKQNRVWEPVPAQVPPVISRSEMEITYHESSLIDQEPFHAPVFARMQTNAGVHQKVTTDDLISRRVVQARDSRPKVVISSYVNRPKYEERPKEKIQIAQNWA